MTLTRSGDEIAAFFALETEAEEEGGEDLRARFNIAPSQTVLTIVQNSAQTEVGLAGREAHWKTWGLIPSWSQDPKRGGNLFNARSETADVKPSFRAAWKRRRCLVVADGFYEWTPRNRGHQPYYFRAQSGTLLAMAGLFEEWIDHGPADAQRGQSGEVIESCTVLTTEANADLEEVHHRMPVLLSPDQFDPWLRPGTDPDSLKQLCIPSAVGTLSRQAVSDYVNSPQNDDARCLDAPQSEQPQVQPAQAELFSFDPSSREESQ